MEIVKQVASINPIQDGGGGGGGVPKRPHNQFSPCNFYKRTS